MGKGLEQLSVNGGRFEINQLLFADDRTLSSSTYDTLSGRIGKVVASHAEVARTDSLLECHEWIKLGIKRCVGELE